MNWLPFISPKKADYKRLQDQTQFNLMVHFINKLRDEEVFACMCARVRKRRENEVTRAPNSQSTGFLAVWKQRNEFQQIKQHRAIFVWMKNNKEFMKVRRKQSYNKHLIRRLISQYGWVFLLVELYFGSPKGSPKYCPPRKNTQPHWLVNRLIRYMQRYFVYTLLRPDIELRVWRSVRCSQFKTHKYRQAAILHYVS